MPHKILPAARNSLIQIWHYTDQKWGEDQADKYIHGIYETVKNINTNKHLWRSLAHEGFEGIFLCATGITLFSFDNYLKMYWAL